MVHGFRFGAWIVACALVAATGCQRERDVEADGAATLDTQAAAQALPALTQQLMNALPGDSTVWARLLSEHAVYVGEDGAVMNKRDLLKEFGPFPPGLSGAIEVQDPRVTDLGDVAIIVFKGHETETVYDQHIEVDYLSTYTWRREDGRWRVIAAQTNVLAKDPPPLPVRADRLGACAGTYQLSDARRYVVERRGDGLFGGREGRELNPLIAVGDNVFADAGSPLGIVRVFPVEADGTVERMVERRKFADLTWRRVAR